MKVEQRKRIERESVIMEHKQHTHTSVNHTVFSLQVV